MKLAAILNVHADAELIIDTLDSILTYMTDKILVVVDGISWDKFKDINIPAYKIEGFRHGMPKAPFRNVALGLKTAQEQWQNEDWYCYIEQDVLVTSERFKNSLKLAGEKDVWILGNNGHVDGFTIPIVDHILNEPVSKKNSYYLLGCCQFMSGDFLRKLVNEYDFFTKFLELTNGMDEGVMPGFGGYDVSEHMYPTLVRCFQKNVGVFASWDYKREFFHGHGQYFPMKWKPELHYLRDNFPEASLMHPLKDLNNPIRIHHRNKRKLVKHES